MKGSQLKAFGLLAALIVASIAWETMVQYNLARVLGPHSVSLTNAQSSIHFDALLWTLKERALVKDKRSLLHILVNPFSPILLCDHHFGVNDLPRSTPVTLRPLDQNSVQNVAHLDIVCCQTEQFETFAATIVPLLPNKIILFTHKWNTPMVTRSNWTDSVRENPVVAHWFSQNPIYESDATYSAFPYGIEEVMWEAYAEALLKHSGSTKKSLSVQHLHLSITNAERTILPERPLLKPNDYYAEISRAQFLLSPPGDRPECYRHWEAIGLGTVPISSVNETYHRPLFGRSMKFVPTVTDMLPLLNRSSAAAAGLLYAEPSRHFVFSAFWASRVRDTKLGLLAADGPPDTKTTL